MERATIYATSNRHKAMAMNSTDGVSKRIPSLDGLRALSLSLVVLGHLGGTQGFPRVFDIFEKYANLGVRVFFVISGYLITTLLMDEYAKYGRISLKGFYTRRAFRILPAAYAYIILIAVVYWHDLSLTQIYAAFLYLSSNIDNPWVLGHLWSLSVEEQFYIVWPLAVVVGLKYGGMRLAKWFAFAGVVGAPLIHATFWYFGWKDNGHYLITVGDSLAMGCWLAFIWNSLQRFDRLLLSSLFALLMLVPLIWLPLLTGQHGALSKLIHGAGFSVMHGCVALLLYHVVKRRYRALNTPAIVWIGMLSYSIYLWQMPFLNRGSTVWWAAFPANLILAFFAGLISYYAIERPFLRLRYRITGKNNVISTAQV